MKHVARANAAELDADHAADPYDPLLRAGICRTCGQPCAWPPEPVPELAPGELQELYGK